MHAGELAVVMREFFRHQEIEDRDAFVLRVFLLPRRRFHFLEAGAHDDFHFIAAEAARGAAAIHRRVAAAQHDHALADLRRYGRTKRSTASRCRYGCWRCFLAAGNFQIAAARRAAADEDRIVIFREQRFHTVDARAEFRFRLQVENVIALFIQHRSGRRNFGICVRIMPPANGSAS